MLTYEDELALSDKLVARREVNDRLKEQGREPSPEEQDIIRIGTEAAAELVEEYLPKVRSIAAVASRKYASANLDYEDFVNEGVDAAMRTANSFNARGKDGRAGVRFARYAELSINKAVNRLGAKMSTLVKDDVSVIQASWAWLAVKAELQERFGREPTDDEVEEASNISSDYVNKDLPHRAKFVNLDDDEANNDIPDEDAGIMMSAEHELATAQLNEALDGIFNEEFIEAFNSYMGTDRMYPREYDDMAEHMGISRRKANQHIALIRAALVHPHIRVMIGKKLLAV